MIHDDHPFQTPPGERDPVRQFRGRLTAPVTVVTAGSPGAEVGLTVSSLMVAEGDPGSVIVLIGSGTELWDTLGESSGRFIVHILDGSMRDDADTFATIRPRPGGMFTGVEVVYTDWGPALVDAPNRAYCTMTTYDALPFHYLVRADIDQLDIADLADPAIYFRGDYRKLDHKR